MQRLQRGILIQARDISFQIFAVTNNRPQIQQVRALWIDCLFRNSPRVNVLAWLQRINRKKRLAFVVERSSDWSLKETIERQEVLRCRSGARFLVEFNESAIRLQRLRVALFLVQLLKYLPNLDQLGDSLALAVSQF